jgi:hypothetical protein
VRHRSHPVEGIQVHPESILTPHGSTLLRSFLTVHRPQIRPNGHSPEEIPKN